ncbi:MAG: NB-ARC domain-containing protein [Cyanobacteria bacterium J06626_18]
MARPNYGPQAYRRARRLLEVLLAYANDDIDDYCTHLRPQIEINWQTEKRLVVRTKVRYLEELTDLEPSGLSLKGEHIKEAIKRFEDHVGILEDYRTNTQGSEVWHFVLNLWCQRFDFEGNLRQFETTWEANRSSKSKAAAADVTSDSPLASTSATDSPFDGSTADTLKSSASGHKSLRSWGEAPDVAAFYGREAELETLQLWVLEEQCRVVSLLGMGGMGKTALSVKLAQQVAPEFECVVWRSLRNAPSIQTVLNDWLLTLSHQQRTALPPTVDDSIAALLQDLRSRRCLLILDNFESILQAGQAQGAYRPGYEDYGHLLRSLSDSTHQSCLILTSREKPIGLSNKEGAKLPVRSYQLKGMQRFAVQCILQDQGMATEAGLQLSDRYEGSPLALKIAIATIRDLFGGDVAAFLAEETVVFGDIADLLSQQVNRLSTLELLIMQWLAISREPITLTTLRQKLVPAVASQAVLAALTALQRRSLIEHDAHSHAFTQQPVVMEYITEQVIEHCGAIFEADADAAITPLGLLNRLALMEADAKDYIRHTQRRVIVSPLARQIQAQLGTLARVRKRCDRLLKKLHVTPQAGYAAGNLINLMHEWQLDLAGYDFSHLSVWQLYLPDLHLPDTNFTGADLSRSVFTQTLGGFLAVAYHPQGHQLATAISNEVAVWDIRQGQQLFTSQGHTAWIMCLAYSPDHALIASGSRDQTIRLWDAATGQCLKTLPCQSWIQTVTFSPDGQHLVSGDNEGLIQVWEVATAQYQRLLKGHRDRVLALKFAADGQTLVSSSQDQTVRVWNFASGDCRHTWDISVNWTLAMDVSADGQTLVTGSGGNAVKQWDLTTGECLQTLPRYQSQVWSVAFSPVSLASSDDRPQILTASEDKTIKLWDAASGDCLQTFLGHTQRVWLAAFSPDGRSLVSASQDQTVKIWDVSSGQCLQTFKAYSNWVQSIAFSPVAAASPKIPSLASGGEDQQVRLWQAATGDCLRSLAGHTNRISCVAFNAEGSQIASGSDDDTIRLWDAASGECLRVLHGHRGWVQSVAFSPVAPVLVSGSHDCTVRLWDTTSGECLQTLAGHPQRVKAVAFNPAGTRVASGSDDHTLKLWEVKSGVCLQTLTGHTDWVLAVAFHPQRPLLASGSGDCHIKLWDGVTGDCLATLQAHTHRVRSVAFSPGGTALTSGGDDHTVRLWDLETGDCRQVMAGHTRPVWAVAFSPKGDMLASCSEDETIRLWHLPTGECVQVLRPQRPYEGMNISGVMGLTPAQRSTLVALGAVAVNSD